MIFIFGFADFIKICIIRGTELKESMGSEKNTNTVIHLHRRQSTSIIEDMEVENNRIQKIRFCNPV